eukprot:COSAG01_NODE_3627_length_5854_cov_2.571304_5_plen_130_part_00
MRSPHPPLRRKANQRSFESCRVRSPARPQVPATGRRFGRSWQCSPSWRLDSTEHAILVCDRHKWFFERWDTRHVGPTLGQRCAQGGSFPATPLPGSLRTRRPSGWRGAQQPRPSSQRSRAAACCLYLVQ